MLYTKKGDTGTTKLFDCQQGARLDKNELIFEAIGTVDELNSLLGVVKVISQEKSEELKNGSEVLLYSEIIEKIQNILFSIQAELGGSSDLIKTDHTQYMEEIIEMVEKQIPPITSFVVYGGTLISAQLDVCRAISRRAERLAVGVQKQNMRQVNPHTLQFLNRLSSMLYALARYSNYRHNCSEKSPNYG